MKNTNSEPIIIGFFKYTFLLVSLSIIFSCGKEEKPLFRLDGKLYYQSDILSEFPNAFSKNSIRDLKVVKEFIIYELVYHDFLVRLKEYQVKETVVNGYLEINFEKMRLSDEEIYNYYDKTYKGRVRDNNVLELSHIFLAVSDKKDPVKYQKKLSLMKYIQNQLKHDSRLSFGDLAYQFSEDSQSKNNDGYIGFISDKFVEPPFFKAASGLKKIGEFSDIIETSEGFHIIQLLGTNQKYFQKIKSYLENERKKNRFKQLLFTLRKKGVIELNEKQFFNHFGK